MTVILETWRIDEAVILTTTVRKTYWWRNSFHKSVYAFIAVAETGNTYDVEAAHCVVRQSFSSKPSDKSLEQLVNKPLFQRVGRRVVLNAWK